MIQIEDHLPAELRSRLQRISDEVTDRVNEVSGCILIELLDPEYFRREQLPKIKDNRRHAMQLRFISDSPPQFVDCRGDIYGDVAACLRKNAGLYLKAAEAVEQMRPEPVQA